MSASPCPHHVTILNCGGRSWRCADCGAPRPTPPSHEPPLPPNRAEFAALSSEGGVRSSRLQTRDSEAAGPERRPENADLPGITPGAYFSDTGLGSTLAAIAVAAVWLSALVALVYWLAKALFGR